MKSDEAAGNVKPHEPDVDELKRDLRLRIRRVGLIEVRLSLGRKRWSSAYVKEADVDAIAAAIVRRNSGPNGANCYATFNTLDPLIYARAPGRFVDSPEATTSDSSVVSLDELLIDADPVRPTGVGSTDEQVETAELIAAAIVDWLEGFGITATVQAFSGNGMHVRVMLESLPNTPANVDLLKRVTEAIADRFSTPTIKIDRKVFNPSRISRIAGPVCRKGEPTDIQPHRLARIIHDRSDEPPATRAQLEAIAGPPALKAPQREPSRRLNGHGTATDSRELVDRVVSALGMAYRERDEGGTTKLIFDRCPFDENHKDAAVWIDASGKITANCFHDSCAGRNEWWHWREAADGPRRKLEPRRPIHADDERRADAALADDADDERHAYLDHDPAERRAVVSEHAPEPAPRRLLRLDLANLMDAPIPAPAEVITGFPRGVVTHVAGAGGGGKTNLMFTLAVHVASDDRHARQFAGLTIERGVVLVGGFEDPASILRYQLQRICRGHRLAFDAARLIVLDGAETDGALVIEVSQAGVRSIIETPLFDELRAEAREVKPDLIVIDNASDVFAGNENDRREVRGFVRKLAAIAREHDCAVVLLAHVDKAGLRNGTNGQTYSGSTGWHNSARSRFAVTTQADGRIELRQEKRQFGKLLDPIALRFDEHGVIRPDASATTTTSDDALRDCIARAATRGDNIPTGRAGVGSTFAACKTLPGFPPEMLTDPGRFWGALGRLEATGALVRESYQTEGRKTRTRWVAPIAPISANCGIGAIPGDMAPPCANYPGGYKGGIGARLNGALHPTGPTGAADPDPEQLAHSELAHPSEGGAR
jgi:hypothetical protein